MPEYVPVHLILLPVPVPAGMDPYILMTLAGLYRKTNEDTTPIEIVRAGNLYTLTDGRHRVIASIVAGRRTVLANVTEASIGTQT